MRKLLGTACIALLAAASGCGAADVRHTAASAPVSAVPLAAPATSAHPTPPTSPKPPSPRPTPRYTGPHFTTPEAAMRYLAAAWNRHDLFALKYVTTVVGGSALNDMYKEAVNLRLNHCSYRQGAGDYTCYFDHDYPASIHRTGTGHAQFLAGPARNPGWYMTVFETCG